MGNVTGGSGAGSDEPTREGARGGAKPIDEALELIADAVADIRLRVERLEARQIISARRLELLDDNGAVRLRLGYVGEDDVVGMECFRRNGSLSAFFGQVAGDGSVMFTGGLYDNIVVDFNADDEGGHLRVVDPADPAGARVVDALSHARNVAGGG